MDTVGWAALLPQMLAALGAVFALAGVGKVIGELVDQLPAASTPASPRSRVYCLRHGRLHRDHGQRLRRLPGDDRRRRPADPDPPASAAIRRWSAPIGMLSGFCGTLMTPLAANFNLVPAGPAGDARPLCGDQGADPHGAPPARRQHGADVCPRLPLLSRLTPELASQLRPHRARPRRPANIPTSSTTCWTGAGRRRRARATCTRSSTAASTGTPASTATGCWPACCAAIPDIPEAAAIRALFDERLHRRRRSPPRSPTSHRPSARGFERPYGWAWLLKLQAELLAARRPPLGRGAAARWPRPSPSASATFLPKADYPIRTGVHSSTAFALALAPRLRRGRRRRRPCCERCAAKARDWYLADRDAQAWEPSRRRLPVADPDGGRVPAPAAAGRPSSRAWFDRLPAARRRARSRQPCSRPPPSATAPTARSPTSTA